MFKIGIIGTDNSHAMAFSKLCNLPQDDGSYLYDDMRITHLFGLNDEETERIAKEAKVQNIVRRPEDMMESTDAVMILHRDGKLHAGSALPFIEKKIPVWIDKPLATDINEAKMIIKLADKNGTLITGGSSCKYAYDVLMLKNAVESGALGRIRSGMINFPVMINSEYSGIHFYAPHLVEMTLQVFGCEMRSVHAFEKDGGITAIAHYDSYDIIMNFVPNVSQYTGIILGEKKSVVRDIDISIIYKLGFDRFAWMLRNKKRPSEINKLVLATEIVCAIETAYRENREVALHTVI